MSRPLKDPIVWIDLETTGLDPEEDLILEVGLNVTATMGSDPFYLISSRAWAVSYQAFSRPEHVLQACSNDYVRKMHEDSGLVNACVGSLATPLTSVERRACEFLDGLLGEIPNIKDRPPLAGSSVGFDRGFIARWMPLLNERLHYRNIDISTVKELCRRLNPPVYAHLDDVEKQEQHRALPDLEDTRREARFYADNFLYLEDA